MRALIALAISFLASQAHAQAAAANSSSLWLNVDYTYNDVTFSNSSLTEKARLGGIRGDLGLAIYSNFALSVGGEYQDGNFSADGTTLTGGTVNGLTKDYIRDTRAMANLLFGSLTIAGGIGQREWYNVLPSAYRQRTTYNYFPLTATITEGGLYLKGEYDFWSSGTNKNYMSDVSNSESDTTLNQKSGTGWGAEIGYLLRSASLIETRIFVHYQRWDVSDSDTQNDGVRNLMQPKNNTVVLQAGIGLNF